MVSALVVCHSSQRFQKRAALTDSSALRLPKRAQNIATAAFRTTAVGVRGCGRWSWTEASRPERSKIFSACRIRRWSKPSAWRLLVFADAFPFEFGDFFDEALHFLVIVHRLADAVFPGFGDADLPRFAIMTLNQIQRGVQFTAGAAAVWLAASAGTDRQGSAQEPAIVGESSEPGTETALGVG
jgi:hypothetical protein